jgi:hypothetical protein
MGNIFGEVCIASKESATISHLKRSFALRSESAARPQARSKRSFSPETHKTQKVKMVATRPHFCLC